METKWTPGPWRTMFTGTGWTVNYDGPNHHWLVATINETPYIGTHAENASLIAAAPDLLAALEMAVQVLQDNDLDTAMAGEFEILTDAINKAKR